MASIRIRVGAALDAQALRVFEPLERAGERARANIQKQLNAAGQSGAASARPILAAYQNLDRELEKEANKILKARERAERQANLEVKRAAADYEKTEKQKTRAVEREAARREAIVRRSSEMAGREAAKQAALEMRLAERAARQGNFWSSGGGRIGIGRRAGIAVSRSTAALYGYGGAALSGLSRAFGINTDVSAMMQSGIGHQDLAQKIINSSPEFNTADMGSRQIASKGLLGLAQQTGNATATDTGDVLEGLEAFVAKTGDLGTARDMIGDISKLSRATGTSLKDMSNAAAEVSNNLGDVPDKGKAIYDVMKVIAGQGKLGAVEIKDLAAQMAKVATVAGRFEGSRAENIAILGSMAQEAKLRGGAASATQATTAVQNFGSMFSTKTVFKAWQKAGINPFTDKGHTTLRSPEEIVLEALKYSKGDQTRLATLFPNKIAGRAMEGFRQIYAEKGGGQAGLEEVDREFKRLAAGAMSDADVMNAFGAQMQTTKSKVQIFNNEMQQTAEKVQAALLPAFEELAPAVLGLVRTFSDLATSPELKDFWDTVLHGATGAQGRATMRGVNAQSDASAFIESLGTFEQKNVTQNPYGMPGSPDQVGRNMMAAAPILEKGKEEQAAIAAEIAKQQPKVSEEAKGISNIFPQKTLGELSPQELTQEKKVNKNAEQYAQDKADLARLQQTQENLATAIDNFRNAIGTNTITVKLAPGSPVPGGGGGSEPPNSTPPE
jgi:hypothetical protein